MKKRRALNIIPLVMLGIFIPASHFYPAIQWWGFGFIVLVQLCILAYACTSISSGYFLPVLCNSATTEKVVALSFDDGPNATYTPQILDTLKKYDAPATFFCIGKNIAGNEAILSRINEEGHVLGNHSFSHDFWFDLYSAKKMLADMQQTDSAIAGITGLRPILFRPPYGVINPMVKKAILKGKYIPVGWSIRSLDTAIKDKQKLLLRITGRIKSGDVILLHDSMEVTAAILPELIEQIKDKGYRIVRLDKMLNIPAYA